MPSISQIFRAMALSLAQGKYSPSTRPPQALNSQSTARTSPLSFFTKVGPQSRHQASSLLISTTRISLGSTFRAWAYWAAEAIMVTGSNWLMA